MKNNEIGYPQWVHETWVEESRGNHTSVSTLIVLTFRTLVFHIKKKLTKMREMLHRHKQMNLIIFQMNNYTDKVGVGRREHNPSKF